MNQKSLQPERHEEVSSTPKKNPDGVKKLSRASDKKNKPQSLDIKGYTAFKIHANKLIP